MKSIRFTSLKTWKWLGVAGMLFIVVAFVMDLANNDMRPSSEFDQATAVPSPLVDLSPSMAFAQSEAFAQAEISPTSTTSPTSSDVTTTTMPPVKPEELRYGLWRDGKAVFSDIELLDLFIPAPYARGYTPEQPINFSHRIHVEKNGMECQYCHSNVAKSSFATIPAVELCMGCHAVVKTESPEIKKLKDYWDKKQPVEWEPVNNLPEHAHFNHERHVKAGVGCQSCHGQVQKMDKVERVSSLKMGFCVSCHRDRGVSIDCAVCHY